MRAFSSAGPLALAMAVAACTGTIGGPLPDHLYSVGGGADGGVSGAGTAAGSGAAGTSSAPDGTSAAAEGRVRRLTNREYTNSVADIFGDQNPAPPPTADPTTTGFDNDYESMSMSDNVVVAYQSLAESVAASVGAALETLLPCSSATSLDETTCASQFIARYGRLAYRRALTTSEASQLLGVFSFARGQPGGVVSFAAAIEEVVSALLQSPNYLYRDELGPSAPGGSATARLTGYQLATELSYYLWAGPPDDALLTAAESGALDSDAGVATAVSRLLADPKAQRSVSTFFRQLLFVDNLPSIAKSTAFYPTYSAELATSMLGETTAFVNDVIFDRDASFTTLFTSNESFANADVAGIYGLTGPGAPTGASFVPVTLDATQRAGLVTQPAFITANTDTGEVTPVLDGKAVLEQLFCVFIGPPPNTVPPLPPPAPGVSARARMESHVSSATCAGCHTQLDGAGWTLEQYGGLGQWRTQDEGVTFATPGQGTLIGTDVDGPVVGGVGLARKIAASAQAQACMDTHYLKYALGRNISSTTDASSIAQTLADFQNDNLSVKTLIASVTRSPAFLYRTPPSLSLDGGQ